MQTPAQGSTIYLRKLFIFNHGAGLLVGSCFPFVAYMMLGEAVRSLPGFSWSACLPGSASAPLPTGLSGRP